VVAGEFDGATSQWMRAVGYRLYDLSDALIRPNGKDRERYIGAFFPNNGVSIVISHALPDESGAGDGLSRDAATTAVEKYQPTISGCFRYESDDSGSFMMFTSTDAIKATAKLQDKMVVALSLTPLSIGDGEFGGFERTSNCWKVVRQTYWPRVVNNPQAMALR
jgi:hypothetical protein